MIKQALVSALLSLPLLSVACTVTSVGTTLFLSIGDKSCLKSNEARQALVSAIKDGVALSEVAPHSPKRSLVHRSEAGEKLYGLAELNFREKVMNGQRPGGPSYYGQKRP